LPNVSGPTGARGWRDGADAMTLTSSDARENFPVFAPDGTTIAFSSNQDGERDRFGNLTFDNYLLSVAADDTPGAVQRISDHPGQDSHPWYSSDGEWLVYASERAGISEGAIRSGCGRRAAGNLASAATLRKVQG
jgi:Tol biopolymer transport system component